MRKAVVIGLALALSVATSATALGAADRGVDTENILREYQESNGAPTSEVIGTSKLIRRDDGLKATAHVSGLTPGGVYTFWWVVTPTGGSNPVDSFVAKGAGKVVGPNGKATVRMRASAGDSSIDGFLLLFHDLGFDLATAEVRVEIAYHGQAGDAGANLGKWLSDFWSGTACPDDPANAGGVDNPDGFSGGFNDAGQPHCPVYIVAQHDES